MKNEAFKTKLLTVLLTLCMLLSLVPMTAATAFAANTTTVTNETELTAALNNADCTEIKLGSNIETTGKLYVERTVTLDLNGHTLSCSSENTSIIWVRKNGNLAIKDSGTGGKIDGQNKNCGIEVKGGTLTLESGSIVNCTDADGDGGAVDVSNTGVTETQVKYGKFIMNGGAIMDCKAGDDGGAVDIGSGCTFIMNGGTISSCRADDDGGAVFIKQSGSFELNGGVIQNCSAGANGGAVNIYQDGRFTMTGGTIKSCKVDLGGLGMAVYGSNDKAVVTMTGGTFEDCGAYPYSFDEFTVTFDSDGGSAVTAQKVLNSPAIKPADPTKNGYLFAGWYLEDMQYAFDTTVTTDITLKAHWTPTSASTAITAATIQDVNFNYQPGDAPRATAAVAAADQGKYRIADEWWQELNENDEPVAIWHSDDGIYSTLPTFTAFESGKKYVYSVLLLPERGYDFGREVAATVNGSTVTAVPGTDGYLSLPHVKTMIPTESENPATIDLIEIHDVTVSFKDGDKPVFTGSVSENAAYAFRCEWWSLDSDTGILSTEPEWGGDIYTNKITAFEAGKTYHYGVYVTAYTADISPDAKLKINGREVSYTRIGDDGDTQSFWVETELAVARMADSRTHSEGADWRADTNNGWDECACGHRADTASRTFKWVTDKDATATENGSKHEECSVCGYKKAAVEIPATGSGSGSASQPTKPGSTGSPQTGDSSSVLWLALLCISGGVLTVLGIAGKRKESAQTNSTENPKYPHSKRAVTERPSLPVYKNKGHIQRRHRGGAAADRMTAAHRCPNLEGSRFFVRVQVPMQNQRKNLFYSPPTKIGKF